MKIKKVADKPMVIHTKQKAKINTHEPKLASIKGSNIYTVDRDPTKKSTDNKMAFRDDSDYPLLCSLEEVNEDGEVKTADMFYKQTIKAKPVIERVETAVESLNISINEFGAVNLLYLSVRLQPVRQ